MANLEWNSDSEMYEAIVDGKLVRVSNDEFSESEAEMIKDYLAKGLSKEEAEKKAWDDCRWVGGWLNSHVAVEEEDARF
jgi:hypothetical protein